MRYFTGTLLAFCLFAILPSITQAASFTTNDFITTWDTTKSGTSNSQQITIPGIGAGYSYSIYWESLSSSTATGTIATSTSVSQTITFPEAGQYKVAIKGTYPRIYFIGAGDKLKILTVEQWGNIAWTSMDNAFYGCANLTVPATDAPNLSGVTAMNSTFFGNTSLDNSMNHWDVSHITDMGSLFRGATSFNQPLNNWDVSNVTNMQSLFVGATTFNQPLNNWDVSKVVAMINMFNNSPFNQDISNWNTSNVQSMQSMFRNSPFNQNISGWNTASATNMHSMFRGNTAFNQDISTWDVSQVRHMSNMFNGATAFDQDLSAWDITSIVPNDGIEHVDHQGMQNMFYNIGLSTTNLDSTLTSWAGQSLNSNVPFHLGLKTYSSTGATALATLRNTYNWTITEQYKAIYQEGEGYTLTGTTTQSHINNGSSTTAVEVIPDDNCTFVNWNDGSTANPRTDILTDNLTLSANVTCRTNSSGSSATTRYKKLLEYGNTAEAEAVKEKYLIPTTPSSLSTAITTLATLTANPVITNNPQTRQQLISILQQLVQILRGMTGESN